MISRQRSAIISVWWMAALSMILITKAFGDTPVITSPQSAIGSTYSQFSYQITATNNPTSYSWTATGKQGPGNQSIPGLSLDSTTGLIFGTPQVSGTYNVQIAATNASGSTGSAPLTLVIYPYPLPPVITSSLNVTGTMSTPFTYQIAATNGPNTYSVIDPSDLPPGVSLVSGSGLISGTPTASGTFYCYINAQNPAGNDREVLQMNILPPPLPVITSAPSVTAYTGTLFRYQIAASGGPTSFSASGLPPGLLLSGSTGLIVGAPSQTGTFTSTISAINQTGTGSASLSITVLLGPPSINSAASASGTQGTSFTYQIIATNSPTSFGASGLDSGLSVDSSTGLISGTLALSGTYSATLRAANITGTGSKIFTLTVLPPPPVITSVAAVTGTLNAWFQYAITATNNPTSFNATSLPPGLFVSTTSGQIYGNPTQTGTFSSTITANNVSGSQSVPLVITVLPALPTITSPGLAKGNPHCAFSYQITASSSPSTFTATGLPPGLTLDPQSGLITGTPAQIGLFTATIGAANITGTGSAPLTINVKNLVLWGRDIYGNEVPLPNTLGDVTALAAGPLHWLALQRDGTVVAWGDNYYGQCSVPSGLSDVVAISAQYYHSLALKKDGTVVEWGTTAAPIPAGLDHVVAIAAGGYFSLALKNDGTVVGWGNNSSGQITIPNGLTNVVAIAAGYSHALALKADGTVVSWGSQTAVPAGLNQVASIAAGDNHSLALKTDGSVVAWGNNDSGQTNVPSGLGSVVAIQGGAHHSLALKSDGTVATWGSNSAGQISTPSGLCNVVAIAAGGNHCLALTDDESGGAAPEILSAPQAIGVLAYPFQYQIMAKNAPQNYSAVGLPSGWNLDSSTGMISGTVTQTGIINVNISAINASGTDSAPLTLNLIPFRPVITSTLSVTGTNGSLGSYQITASNGPTSYAATGLPPGMTINSSTGLIQGTPNSAGVFTATISATNPGGTGTAQLVFTVQQMAPPTITNLFTLCSFSGSNGATPLGALVQASDGNFYGTTNRGGLNDYGSVFRITPTGSLTSLFSFNYPQATYPVGGLVQASDGILYGTTVGCGNFNSGTLYGITTTGTITSVFNFSGSNGADPESSLIQASDGNLYGTTRGGGVNQRGSAFAVNLSRGYLDVESIYSFNGDDGWDPVSGMIQGNDGGLYGITRDTTFGKGEIYRMSLYGGLFVRSSLVPQWNFYSWQDGFFPVGAVIQGHDGCFYGTTTWNPSTIMGTIYRYWPGHGLTTLLTFNGSNGSGPQAALVQGDDGIFYGTTSAGGTSDLGTLFSISPSGDFTSLCSFTGTNGANPSAPLIQGRDGAYYGTTSKGGSFGKGTVFCCAPSIVATGTDRGFNYRVLANGNAPTFGADGLPPGLSIAPSTGLITGTPTATGTFVVTTSASNPGGSGFGSLTIRVLPLPIINPLDGWKAAHFTTNELLDPSISGNAACPAGDGISNLMKYALNLDPKANGTGALPVVSPMLTGSGNYLTIRYSRVISATDINYVPEVSDDLQTWYSGSAFTAPVTITNNPDGTTQSVLEQDLTPLGTTPRRFMRLKVTKP